MIIFTPDVTVTFDASSYTVGEGDKQVIVMATMVGNNTVIDVAVTFRTVDDTAIGIRSEEECMHYD